MKNIISICLCIILVMALSVTTFAAEAESERCVFCGAENSLIDSDYCTKCGESFYHRSTLRVNIKSFGDEEDLIEAYLYKGGKVYRLNQAYGNNSVIEFGSVTNGTYLLQITKKGHNSYFTTVYLYGNKLITEDLNYTEMDITLWQFGDNNHDGIVDYKDFYRYGFWYYPHIYCKR